MAQKRKFSGPKRSNRSQAASQAGRSLISRAMRRRGFLDAEIITRWPMIVGAELAAVALPMKLKFPQGERAGATLEVRTEAAFSTMLQHKQVQIIQKVNSYFGYGAVAKLAIRQGPLPKKTTRRPIDVPEVSAAGRAKVDAIVASSKSSDLKDSVRKMLESVTAVGENKQKK